MNFQNIDTALKLNEALFRDNGRSGYILKPEILRNPALKFDPKNPDTMRNKKIFHIKIISAQNLPINGSDISDSYVTVSIHGVPSDECEQKTRVIVDNGFNPTWNENFKFNINCPELAIVRFTVKDEDVGKDDLLGYYAIRFECMRKGLIFF